MCLDFVKRELPGRHCSSVDFGLSSIEEKVCLQAKNSNKKSVGLAV